MATAPDPLLASRRREAALEFNALPTGELSYSVRCPNALFAEQPLD